MDISVIGLGKLGICTAACFAGAGHRVVGYDTDPRVVNALREGRAPVEETDLDAALAAAAGNFRLARDYQDAVESSEITLIIVPTPSQADGRFSNDYVLRVLEQLSPALRAKRSFHVVDVVSTVMPGTDRKSVV